MTGKRGRPLKQRSDTGEMYRDHGAFERNLLAVWAYQQALAGGKNGRAAIAAAVALIAKRWPARRISKSTVSRALQEFQPALPAHELPDARARLDGALARGEVGAEEHRDLQKQFAVFKPERFIVDLTEHPDGSLTLGVSIGIRPEPAKTPRRRFRFGKG